MIHFLLRIAVWVVVIGFGYLVFGPQLLDSSRRSNPFESDSVLFLPPPRSPRQVELEEVMKERGLNREEREAYQTIVRERQSRFWQREGVSVEAALSGVKRQRKAHLAKLLTERGVTEEEAAIFFLVVERDHPTLLADQD